VTKRTEAIDTEWLSEAELAAWVRFSAMLMALLSALDTQMRRDAKLSFFSYSVLAGLSEAPERTLRMTSLAQRTNATLPRLSHVVRRLEDRGLVERFPCPEDGRATNARLTTAGWDTVVATAPGHVNKVRELVLDPLSPAQVAQLRGIGDALLTVLDPTGHMTTEPHSGHVDQTA